MSRGPLVLVIDDEKEQRLYFQRMLTSRGYRVILSANGADGLKAACVERPALVILDLNMPGMDGIGCYRLFKKVHATRKIPILFTTALSLTPGVLKLVSDGLGGTLVLLKQDGLEKLLSMVASVMEGIPLQPGFAPEISADVRRFQRAGREVAVDVKTRRISIDGRELPQLAARRFDLLSELLEADGAVSRSELLMRIWNGNDNLNLVDVTVLRLRQDLKKVRTLRINMENDGYLVVFRGPPPSASLTQGTYNS